MRLAYANTYFQKKHKGGGHVHMGQFVSNAVALGHEIWAWPGNEYLGTHTIPSAFPAFIKTMRQMDVLYVRLERNPPNSCKWALPPYRNLYGFPLVVWEFNSIPEEGFLRNQPEHEIRTNINLLKQYSRGCDLAVCMTSTLADHVKKNFGIQRTLVVPNGSDPELFRPDALPVKRMLPFKDQFNVVWIGSANIEYHDFHMLREAAQLLWERGDGNRIVFHVIGSGLTGMGEMPPNVYYWGAEQYDKLSHWLAAMDVGLYLSHGEATYHATPLKLFDYLASGLTVVSTQQPFMRILFDQLGQPDLLVPPDDSARLADILLGLEKDRARVHRQGQAGREIVIEHYNWRRAVVDTMNEMESMLLEKRS